MIVDLHNHTKLCNHAKGEMDEYIKVAIEKGVKYFGFSDHAPMDFDQKYRMYFSQMKIYEKSVLNLQQKYKNNIEILLGYEVDFLPKYIDKKVLNSKVDYLIGSVHFLNDWRFNNPVFIGEYKNKNIDSIWMNYFKAIEDLAKSGLFDIVGHIDFIKVFNYLPKKEIKIIAKEAIKEIKKSNMVVEINTRGYKKPINEPHPSKEILELIADYDIPITFGSDAHLPEDICEYEDKLIDFIKEFNFTKCAVFKNRDRKMIEI